MNTTIALLFLFVSLNCFSEYRITNNTQQTPKIEEVIVSAARIPLAIMDAPMAIDKLERKQITRAQTQLGLDESLTGIPGLVLQNRFNFAQDLRISIRGFGSRANFGIRGIKIIVDGAPETLADGQGSIDSIDIASIGSVEILRGTSSSLYGNASGGVIIIESDFDNPKSGIEARFAVGADGYKKNQIHLNGKSKDLSYIASLSHLSIEGYRQHSEHKNTLFNSRLRYKFSDNSTLKLSFNHTDQPLANDPGGVDLAKFLNNRTAARDRNVMLNSGEALKQTRIGVSYHKTISANSNLRVRNYHVRRDFNGRIPISSNGIIEINRYFTGGGLMYSIENSLAGKKSSSIIGVDYDYQDDDRERFENLNGLAGNQVLNQREKVTSTGLYFQNQIHLNNYWILNGGIRYDKIAFTVKDHLESNSGKRTLGQLSPMLASSLKINENTAVYVNISSAFETPTTTELALIGNTGLNKNLDAQEALSYELGIKGAFVIGSMQEHRYSAALFNIDVKQEIVALEDGLGRDVFVNAGESSRRGVEFSLKSQLSETLSSSLAYTYSDFTYKTFIDKSNIDHSGNALPGLPRNTLHFSLNFQTPSGLFASLETLYLDKFALDNSNSVHMDSSLVTDFRVSYKYSFDGFSIEPFIGISNLFNEVYSANARINAFGGRYYESAPERNLYAGLSIRHNFNG